MLQIAVSVNAPEQDQWLRKLTDMRPCHGKTSQDQVNVRSLYLWVNCTLKVEPTKQMHIFTHSVAKQQLTAWNLVLLVQQTCAVYKVVFFKLLKKTFVQSVRNWIETVWRCSLKASDKMSCYLFIFKFKRKVKVAIKKKNYLPVGLFPSRLNSHWDRWKGTGADWGCHFHSKTFYFLSEKLLYAQKPSV